jgi:hypothetical protein
MREVQEKRHEPTRLCGFIAQTLRAISRFSFAHRSKNGSALDQGLAFWLLLRNGKSNSPLGEINPKRREHPQAKEVPSPLPLSRRQRGSQRCCVRNET